VLSGTAPSKKTTIKTWLAPQHLHRIDEIQKWVAMTVRENPFSLQLSSLENESNGQLRRVFQTSRVEVKFLQWVNQLSQANQHPVTMELAGGLGLASWKVPYCFKTEGTHYVNDIHFSNDAFAALKRTRFPSMPNLEQMLHPLPGDCLKIPQTHPHLMGSIHAILVENLEPFLNPLDHQRFLDVVEGLLAPGGRAFIGSESFSFKKGDPLYALYLESKKAGDLYPGFAQYDVTTKSLTKDTGYVGDPVFSNPVRPVDHAPFETLDIEAPKDADPIFHPEMGWIPLKAYK